MEDSFTENDDLTSIVELCDQELCALFDNDVESFFQKIENFQKDFEKDSCGRGFAGNAFLAEKLVRSLIPTLVKNRSNEDGKIVKLFSLVLSSLQKLLAVVVSSLETGLRDRSFDDAEECCKASLQISMALLDLARDMIESNEELYSDDSVAMVIVHRIPDILETALDHCHNSPKIYGPDLSNYSELRMFFLKCKATLMTFVSFVNNGMDQFLWNDLEDFMLRVDRLQPILLDLDFHAFGLLCKTYLKIYSSQCNELARCSRYSPLPHFVFICKQAENSTWNLKKFIAAQDESSVKRESNILSFLLKSTRQQLKILENDKVDQSLLFKTFLSLASTLSLLDDVSTCDSSARPQFGHDIPKLSNEIPSLIFALCLQVSSNPDFAEQTLNLIAEFPRGSSVFFTKILSWFWSQRDVDLAKIWFIDFDKNLFRLMVKSLENDHEIFCEPPILPGVQYSGRPLKTHTTYEFIITRVQSFIAGLPPDLLSHVEFSLVETILDENAPFWSAYLCLDVWSFLARYGPRELCCSHVKLLIDIYQKSSFRRNFFLERTIGRLFSFLCPEDMKKLEREFSVNNDIQNLRIWSLVSGKILIRNKVPASNICAAAWSNFQALEQGNFRSDQISVLSSSVQILSEHFGHSEKFERKDLKRVLFRFWSKLRNFDKNEFRCNLQMRTLMTSVFELTAKVLSGHCIELRSLLSIIVEFASSQYQIAPYIVDRTSRLLLQCTSSNKELVEALSNQISPASQIPLSLGVEVKSDSMDDDKSYFENLNHHSPSKCPGPPKCDAIPARRELKRRRLIDVAHVRSKDTPEDREMMKHALKSIKREVETQNLSPSSKLSYLSAVKTLEGFLS